MLAAPNDRPQPFQRFVAPFVSQLTLVGPPNRAGKLFKIKGVSGSLRYQGKFIQVFRIGTAIRLAHPDAGKGIARQYAQIRKAADQVIPASLNIAITIRPLVAIISKFGRRPDPPGLTTFDQIPFLPGIRLYQIIVARHEHQPVLPGITTVEIDIELKVARALITTAIGSRSIVGIVKIGNRIFPILLFKGRSQWCNSQHGYLFHFNSFNFPNTNSLSGAFASACW